MQTKKETMNFKSEIEKSVKDYLNYYINDRKLSIKNAIKSVRKISCASEKLIKRISTQL